jgi:hypothetical protein
MLRVIFTLDYEIHGNGEGCPGELMVEPTRRMMDLFERYGAKLTIMADVAEILRFKNYKEQTGRDDYHYEAIADQLRDAMRRGHDVQLHLHASYFNARHQDGHWSQDYSEYNFAGLSLERLNEVVRLGKQYLQDLLKPVAPKYECIAFRAANWAMSPSKNVVRALVNNGFKIDTSVFKYGFRSGLVNFDYRSAPSALVPWRVDENDICARNENGELLEFPIYSENRWIGSFLTLRRISRACVSRLHRLSPASAGAEASRLAATQAGRNGSGPFRWLRRRHAWKADFNQCAGRQLIEALNRASRNHDCGESQVLPFVLIGHSKLFTRSNERSLKPFLKHVIRNPGRFQFGLFDCSNQVAGQPA